MRLPYSPLLLVVFVFALGFLLAVVQIGALTIAFDKLGLTTGSAFVLLFASLFGSAINIPLFTVTAERPPSSEAPAPFRRLLRYHPLEFSGRTIVAVNVGGCLIPLAFSVYLMESASACRYWSRRWPRPWSRCCSTARRARRWRTFPERWA